MSSGVILSLHDKCTRSKGRDQSKQLLFDPNLLAHGKLTLTLYFYVGINHTAWKGMLDDNNLLKEG